VIVLDKVLTIKSPKRIIFRGALTKIGELVNWSAIEEELKKMYSGIGRPSHPPLMLFKMILLQHLYQLSDPQTKEIVNDRYSFRTFIGLPWGEAVPDETTLVRFRQRLLEHGLHDKLLTLVNQEIAAKGFELKKGVIVDSTLVRSASRQDEEAKSMPNRKKQEHHGYKAHVCTDAQEALVVKVEVSSANVHDIKMFEEVLPEEHGEIYADKAYDKMQQRKKLGERCKILYRGRRNRKLTEEQLEFNREASRVRARVEKIFGHWKRVMEFAVVRYIGLKKMRLDTELKAVCWNLKRLVNLVKEAKVKA